MKLLKYKHSCRFSGFPSQPRSFDLPLFRQVRPSYTVIKLLVLLLLTDTTAAALTTDNNLRLPSPTYPLVVEHYLKNKPADALTTLEQATADTETTALTVESLVLRARLLEQLKRLSESNRIWKNVVQLENSLSMFARLSIVKNLVNSARAEEAEAYLKNTIGISTDQRILNLLLDIGDAYYRAGDFPRTISIYSEVLRKQNRGRQADRARLGLSFTYESQNELEHSMRMFHNTFLQHTVPETFTTAWESERRLTTKLGVPPPNISEDHLLSLTRKLRSASHYHDALAVTRRWRNDYPSTKRRDLIETETIITLYDARANDDAIEKCGVFIEKFSHSPYIPKVKLTQFRLATRTGQTKLVKSLGYPLWEGRVSKSDEIRWSAGILLAAYLVSIGDLEEGLDIYRGLFQRAKSRGRQLDILWRAGVAAIRANQNERARTNLLGVLRRNPGSTMDSATRFWLAIANNRLGRRVDALRTLITLEQQNPFHYYGIRAHEWIVREGLEEETELIQRLREKSSPSKLKFPPLRLNNSTQRHPHFVASTYLARAGLKVEAAQYARRALRENRKDSALALLTARASGRAGEHRYSLSILANYFGQFLQRPTKNLPEDFWHLAYPRPFFDDIKTAATTHNVDPLLLVSLMRQESRFDKQAKSSVGAIGLFQIMPYTAAELAPELGLSIPDDMALMEPSINSALAGALLSRLNLEFSGETPPIVASYNAGKERVHAWWKAARYVPLELFVDTIPYSETRGFVREVLTNYNEYRRLYPTRP